MPQPTTPQIHRQTDKINNHIINEEFSADSYNYPEYCPVIPHYENQDEYQNGYQELFYENYTEPEIIPNNYAYPQSQRPFSASSSSCSSIESSEINQYNYTNLISFYNPNQNGRQVDSNFGGNFGKMTPPVQDGGYTSVIVDNTQQYHSGSVNEFVH